MLCKQGVAGSIPDTSTNRPQVNCCQKTGIASRILVGIPLGHDRRFFLLDLGQSEWMVKWG
jgi:hypothetical protein